ncbi:MAG: Major facilitator superfamily MFS_1, partial [Pseudothermotoga lettingae]
MFAIICVGSTLGILYAISNLVLIPYLIQKLGDMQAASLVFSAGILCTAFVGPLIGSLVD